MGLLIRILVSLLCLHPVLSGRSLDASTTQPEDKWYVASDDWQRLNHYCSMWRGARRFDCVDVFSHSQRFASAFARAGFMAVAYDIKSCAQQDVTCQTGFMMLLEYGLATLPGAFMPMAPPCSLFVGISQGTHRRSEKKLEGDTKLFCVRLSNLILNNAAIFLLLMQNWRPGLYVMLENPLSSWLVKQKLFLKASKLWGMQRYVTYLGAWGHDLLKPTVLFSTLPTLSKIARPATKELRKKHRELIAKRNARKRARGQPVKEYYHRDKNGKFHGGKDLASSAVYPHSFIKAVFQCWQENRLANASGQ